jgi:hypothetical protein
MMVPATLTFLATKAQKAQEIILCFLCFFVAQVTDKLSKQLKEECGRLA